MMDVDPAERWKLPCPKCKHRHVHYSHPKWHERAIAWIGILSYRCYKCGNRFLHRRIRESDGYAGNESDAFVKDCPNCGKRVTLDLSPPEFAEAMRNGWYVSCPGCRAAFVARVK